MNIKEEKNYSLRFNDKENEEKNLMVLGTCGSGKTFLFLQEIKYIIDNSDDEVIVFAKYPEEYKKFLRIKNFTVIKFEISTNKKELLDTYKSILDNIKTSNSKKWLYIDSELLSFDDGIPFCEILLELFIKSKLKNTSLAIALRYLSNQDNTLSSNSNFKKILQSFTYFIFEKSSYRGINIYEYCPIILDLFSDPHEIDNFLYHLGGSEQIISTPKGWLRFDGYSLHKIYKGLPIYTFKPLYALQIKETTLQFYDDFLIFYSKHCYISKKKMLKIKIIWYNDIRNIIVYKNILKTIYIYCDYTSMRIYDVKKDYILDYFNPVETIIPSFRNSFIKIKGYFIKKKNIELIEQIINKIQFIQDHEFENYSF